MSSEADAAKLFCQLYPALRRDVVLNDHTPTRQRPGFSAVVRDTAARVAAGEPIELPQTGGDLAIQRHVLAVMKGIDDAFLAVHPRFGGRVVPGPMTDYVVRLDTCGRYNASSDNGLLLPKLACAIRDRDPKSSVDKLSALFGALTFVPAAAADTVDHRAIAAEHRATHDVRAAGIHVVCVPFLEHVDELSFEYPDRDELTWYRIDVRDCASMRARAVNVAGELAAGDARLAVLPEMAAPAWLTEFWAEQLPLGAIAGSPLRWALMGTGDLSVDGRPSNEAVLLDAVTGEELLRQHKLHRFNIAADLVTTDYRLPDAPSGVTLNEDIDVGDKVTIVEMGAMRVAVLICEDLARLEELLPQVVPFGVSHILSPVFSKPTEPYRWEQAKGAAHSEGTGTTVVVVNSIVLGRLKAANAPIPFALALSPDGAKHLAAASADVMEAIILRDDESPVRV